MRRSWRWISWDALYFISEAETNWTKRGFENRVVLSFILYRGNCNSDQGYMERVAQSRLFKFPESFSFAFNVWFWHFMWSVPPTKDSYIFKYKHEMHYKAKHDFWIRPHSHSSLLSRWIIGNWLHFKNSQNGMALQGRSECTIYTSSYISN